MLSHRPIAVAVLSGIILLGSQAGLYRSTADKDRATHWVAHTYEVMRALSSIESGLALAEASVWAWSSTTKPTLLPDFHEGVERAGRGLGAALRLTVDNPAAQQQLAELAPRVELRLAQLQAAAVREDDDPPELGATIEKQRLSSEIRGRVAVMMRDEQHLLTTRVERSAQETKRAEHIAMVGGILATAMCALVFWVGARRNAQLREAKIAAEAAAQTKTTFLANMSHEIRTPLTALLGFADLLLDTKLSVSDRENYALTIRRNGEHLLSILNDILDISMVEAGKLSIERIEFSPANLLSEVASLMRVRAIDKGLAFGVEYETAMPTATRNDATRLRQIVLNLVSNAVKFTERGSVRIVARCDPTGKESEVKLAIRVIDSGIGMDSAQVQRLFQPFAQGDASTTRKFGGSGLGLAICAPLAQAMGGAIAVNSVPGQGTTFTLTVPVEIAAGTPWVSSPAEVLSGAQPPTAAPGPGAEVSGHILLAEDGPDNQVLICTVLRRQGFEVTVVANGLLAVERATAAMQAYCPYDVVLMDMQMPVLDGYGAVARLRSSGYKGAIIALTAHAMKGERERCLAVGCDEYLTKPLNRTELVRAVSARVKQRPRLKPTLTGRTTLPANDASSVDAAAPPTKDETGNG